MLSLQKFFSCGTVCIDNKKENACKFQVDRVGDLLNIIIPHFSKYKLLSSKHLDFLDFQKAVFLFKNNSRSANMDSILSIKNGMNSKRSYDKRWHHFNIVPFIEAE